MTLPRRFSFDVRPGGRQPAPHFFPGQHRQGFLYRGRRTILAALSKKENVLDVVLYNCPRLVGLAVETGAVPLCFGNSVGDLEP
jgi:hypothetical protein